MWSWSCMNRRSLEIQRCKTVSVLDRGTGRRTGTQAPKHITSALRLVRSANYTVRSLMFQKHHMSENITPTTANAPKLEYLHLAAWELSVPRLGHRLTIRIADDAVWPLVAYLYHVNGNGTCNSHVSLCTCPFSSVCP